MNNTTDEKQDEDSSLDDLLDNVLREPSLDDLLDDCDINNRNQQQ